MTLVAMRAALLLAVLAGVPGVRAAEQPLESPGDFRNGQSNSFGSISLSPYLPAGGGSVPVEARIILHDLAALRVATDVLFAFNLKGDSAEVTLDSVRTAEGLALVPTSTVVVDGGRQPQAHFEPADLLAVAEGGRIDLVLSGRVEAKADGQSHLGAMVLAFDEAWDVLPSGDGSAQVYGFTLVMAQGVGGGAMPFQGQGNTWLVLPVAFAAFVATVAGIVALRAATAVPPSPATGVATPTTSVGATSMTSAGAPMATARPGATAPGLAVFGGPASPVRAAHPRLSVGIVPRPQPQPPLPPPVRPAFGVPVGPRQGPLLPPRPPARSVPAAMNAAAPVAANPTPPAPSARARSATSRVTPSPRADGAAKGRAASRPKPAPKGTARRRAPAARPARRQASR